MLVLDDRPVELDAHLARLEASLSALYPRLTHPLLDAPSLMHPYRHSNDGTSASALRIAVAPDGNGALAATTEQRQAPPGEDVALHSLTVPGGLGAHKWVDRSLLDDAQTSLHGNALPMLVDADGTVLEASRANVFAVRDGALFTPPLNGRILPGITRMRILELAGEIGPDVHEAELAPDDLLAADEVFLTGSVRGIERVDSLDGAPLRSGGEIADRLTTELWRSWAGAKTAL